MRAKQLARGSVCFCLSPCLDLSSLVVLHVCPVWMCFLVSWLASFLGEPHFGLADFGFGHLGLPSCTALFFLLNFLFWRSSLGCADLFRRFQTAEVLGCPQRNHIRPFVNRDFHHDTEKNSGTKSRPFCRSLSQFKVEQHSKFPTSDRQSARAHPERPRPESRVSSRFQKCINFN